MTHVWQGEITAKPTLHPLHLDVAFLRDIRRFYPYLLSNFSDLRCISPYVGAAMNIPCYLMVTFPWILSLEKLQSRTFLSLFLMFMNSIRRYRVEPFRKDRSKTRVKLKWKGFCEGCCPEDIGTTLKGWHLFDSPLPHQDRVLWNTSASTRSIIHTKYWRQTFLADEVGPGPKSTLPAHRGHWMPNNELSSLALFSTWTKETYMRISRELGDAELYQIGGGKALTLLPMLLPFEFSSKRAKL